MTDRRRSALVIGLLAWIASAAAPDAGAEPMAIGGQPTPGTEADSVLWRGADLLVNASALSPGALLPAGFQKIPAAVPSKESRNGQSWACDVSDDRCRAAIKAIAAGGASRVAEVALDKVYEDGARKVLARAGWPQHASERTASALTKLARGARTGARAGTVGSVLVVAVEAAGSVVPRLGNSPASEFHPQEMNRPRDVSSSQQSGDQIIIFKISAPSRSER